MPFQRRKSGGKNCLSPNVDPNVASYENVASNNAAPKCGFRHRRGGASEMMEMWLQTLRRRNVAPATKNDRPKCDRNLVKTDETSFTMRGRSETDPRPFRA